MYSPSSSSKQHVWRGEQSVPFSSAAKPTANLWGAIKFTELSPRCTPSCAFSRQGQHSLFRQCSHIGFTTVSVYWLCGLRVHCAQTFLALLTHRCIRKHWLFLCSLPILLSFFRCYPLVVSLFILMFCLFTLPFKLCEKGLCDGASLLFRWPTHEVESQLGEWKHKVTTYRAPAFLWMAEDRLRGEDGVRQGEDYMWVQTQSPLLLAAHIPQ